jgi:hypothetical protein
MPTRDIARPEDLIGSHVIINASGAGKSYVLRRILEETHGQMQHLVPSAIEEMVAAPVSGRRRYG